MWINEVGVATTHRGQGVAKAILQRLLFGDQVMLTFRLQDSGASNEADGGAEPQP